MGSESGQKEVSGRKLAKYFLLAWIALFILLFVFGDPTETLAGRIFYSALISLIIAPFLGFGLMRFAMFNEPNTSVVIDKQGIDIDELEEGTAELETGWRYSNNPEKKVRNPDLREMVEDKLTEGWRINDINNEDNRVVMARKKDWTLSGFFDGLVPNLKTVDLGDDYNREKWERKVLRVEEGRKMQGAESKIDELERLHRLYQKEALSESEFEEMKSDLFGKQK